jgi:hypothetical protein
MERAMKLGSLSQACGIPLPRLEALESGVALPNRRELRLLAGALRIAPDKMLLMSGQMRLI